MSEHCRVCERILPQGDMSMNCSKCAESMDNCFNEGCKEGYLKGLEVAREIAKTVMGHIPDASNGRYNACTEMIELLDQKIKAEGTSQKEAK